MKSKFTILFALLILFTVFTRFLLISDRPLHHDEGVNYYFAQKIIGESTFTYDPQNYHGPLYFFFLVLSFTVLGVNELSLRLPAIIFGIFLVVLPFFFVKNKKTALYIACFLCLSPSILFFSRYSIHEISLVFFSTLLFFLTTKFLESKKGIFLPYIALCIAFLITTKETSMLPIAIALLLCLIHYKEIKNVDWKNNKFTFFISIFIFIFVYTSIFSSFYTNIQSLINSLLGYFPWIQRGISESGHQKPFFYYLLLISKYEFPLIIISLSGLILLVKKIFKGNSEKDIFFTNIALWFFINFLVYSFIHYKVPWLVINITVPAAIFSGLIVSKINNNFFRFFIFCSSMFLLFLSNLYLVYMYPWQESNQYAYVHTHNDIKSLSADIQFSTLENEKILIVSSEYWPLPFYLHNRKVEYLAEDVDFKFGNYENYDAYIVRDSVFETTNPPKNFQYSKYILRGDIVLYFVHKYTK